MPPFGMASRALTAMLTMASSSSARSTFTGQTLGFALLVVDDVAAQRTFDHRPHVADAGVQIDHGRGQVLAAGEGQQLPGQAFAALGRGLDGLDRARQFRVEQPLEGLRIAADDYQQVVEVVGDAAGQFADGFHLLRHGELLGACTSFSWVSSRSVMSRTTLAKPIRLPECRASS